MGLYDITIYDIITKNATFHPKETALVCGDLRLSHAQFRSEVDSMAASLASIGLIKGDRVGVVAFNCHEFLVLYGAAARLGLIMLPANWRLKPEEIKFIMDDCTPKAVVAGPEYIEALKPVVDSCPFVEHRLSFGDGGGEFQPLKALGGPSHEAQDVDVGWNDPFVIIHTAAVAGRPRGAVLTHGNLIASNIQAMAVMGVNSTDSYLNMLPLFHIAGLGFALNVMQAGGKNVIQRRFDAQEAVELIERERITLIGTFPPMLSMLLDQAEESARDITSIRAIGGLDHPDNMKRAQQVTGGKAWVGFGQTETSGFCSLCSFDERPGSAGREAPLVRLRIVDDYDRDVPAGQPGEILVRGPLVFQGYWGLKEDTEYTFREGWHHTGDIGRLDEEGYLWYVKRKAEKELIKPGGENVYPAEVEKVLLEHPDVVEACVFGVPDKQWGEAIKAVCAIKEGSALEPQQLIDFVADRIARYKKPKYVDFVKELPKTQDGSVDREKVKAEHGLKEA